MLYVLFGTVSVLARFLSGDIRFEFPWSLLSWVWATGYALILWYAVRLAVPQRTRRLQTALYLAPAVAQFVQDAFDVFLSYRTRTTGFEASEWLISTIRPLLWLPDLALLYLGVRFVGLAYRSRTAIPGSPSPAASGVDSGAPLGPVLSSSDELGLGDRTLDRVIRSISRRSYQSQRVARFSMNTMIALVLVGSVASFGFWFLSHVDRTGTLESETAKVQALERELSGLSAKMQNDLVPEMRGDIEGILKIVRETYGDRQSLHEVLTRLSVQSQASGSDIAIRVTIAVLTLFLVQVFFAVYRHHQQLSSVLASKAEALELVGEDEAAMQTLSAEAIQAFRESLPGFGAGPRTVLDEAARITERIVKRD